MHETQRCSARETTVHFPFRCPHQTCCDCCGCQKNLAESRLSVSNNELHHSYTKFARVIELWKSTQYADGHHTATFVIQLRQMAYPARG